MPTLNRKQIDRLRDEQPEPWTNGEWLVVLGLPVLAGLSVLFVMVLGWLGEL